MGSRPRLLGGRLCAGTTVWGFAVHFHSNDIRRGLLISWRLNSYPARPPRASRAVWGIMDVKGRGAFRLDDGRERLLIATHSRRKLRELASLLDGVSFRCVSLDEAGIREEVPENGSTLEENAAIKASGYARLSGMLTLADDTGLEVDALGGEPGVRSARYAPGSAEDRNALLLRNLEGVDCAALSARFRCVIAIAAPGATPGLYEGVCEGRIVREARGAGGFGYDPIFFVPELGRTMAELTTEEKNLVSHRGTAARKAAAALMSMNGVRPQS